MQTTVERGRWATEGQRWLRDQLAARQWRQADLVRQLPGVPSGTVSRWVRGVQPPDPAYAVMLAEVFGADPDYVLALAERRVERVGDDPDVRDIAATARLLSPNGRRYLRQYADFMLRQERQGAAPPPPPAR